MAKYIYPAIFAKEGDFYTVRFPDLESCYTQGDSLQEAYEMASDVLCLTLYNLEEAERAFRPLLKRLRSVRQAANLFHSFLATLWSIGNTTTTKQ